jgi:hypothetical protein
MNTNKVTDFKVGDIVKHATEGTAIVLDLDYDRDLVSIQLDSLDSSVGPWRVSPGRLSHVDSKPAPLSFSDKPTSLRFNDGKTQTREISPDFVLGIGEVLTKSREKYPEGNWMKETKFSTPYESCVRHLMKFWSGEDLDNDTLKSHLLHAATNLMFLHFHLSSGVGIDDRLFKKEKK